MKRSGLTVAAMALLLIVIIVVSSVAVVAAFMGGAGKTTTSSSSSMSSSTSAKDGLRLSLNATVSETGSSDRIAISISDFNTLSTANTPAIVGMPSVGGTALGLDPCSQLPLGFAVAEGNYGANNVSEASPLSLWQPGTYMCPAEFAVDYFSFSPLSDNVTLYSPQPSGSGSSTVPTPMWTAPDAFNQSFSGYWTGGSEASLQSGAFNAFQPGIYTLVGGDDYGQLVFVHVVLSSQATVTSTTGQSSSSVSTTVPSGGQNISVASQYGLRLMVNMNATEIVPGESVQVNLTEFNTLPRVNNVSASGDWPVGVALGPCENEFDQPFGIAVYAGHVDAQNLSQGQRVDIFPAVACPMYIRLVTGYEFQPQSNLAVVLPGSATPSPLVGSVVLSMSYSPQAQPLPPGVYTVVAADEWGALAFLYFQVN